MKVILISILLCAFTSGAPHPPTDSRLNQVADFFGDNGNIFSDLNVPGFGNIPGFGRIHSSPGNTGLFRDDQDHFPGFSGTFTFGGSSKMDNIPLIPTGNNPGFGASFGFPLFGEGNTFPFQVQQTSFDRNQQEDFPFQVEQQEFPFEFTQEEFPFQVQQENFPSQEEESNVEKKECGLLCMLFKMVIPVVGTPHKQIDGIVTEMHDKKNDIDTAQVEDDGEYDINNRTYLEKVLPDGTVLKINKTVVADTDDNGNSFFFHSSVLHNIGDGNEGTISDEVDTKMEKNYDIKVEDAPVASNDSEEKNEYLPKKNVNVNAEPEHIFNNINMMEYPDPSENEISPTADVRDLFE